MNFEAVPCMLRTGADGSSVYGLLIRPSAGVVQQQQQQQQQQQLQPQSTVILQQPTTSGQQPTRSLQLVPSGAIQQQAIAPAPPHSSGNNKILLPHVSNSSAPMHLQLATAPLGAKFSAAPHVAGISVVHSLASYGGPSSTTAPVYSAPNVFDSPSPSQVVPQMSVSDGYEHAPVTSSVVSTAQPTTQHVYMQPLMEQYDYAQQPLTSSSATSYPKPTASASLDVSGLELLDDLAPMDIARILAESESILSPDCPMLEGAVVDAHSSHSYNPMHEQHMEQPQASCSSAHLGYSVQQQQQVQSSSSRAPLNIQVSCQQQQQLFPSGSVNARMPACRYLPQQQQHLQQQQQQQLRPALTRRNAAAAPPLPGIRPALRPQLDWEQGPNDSSGTPDSGIQSIAGSPPSNGVYTPPLMSPSLRNNSGHQARRSSGPPQISPTARTSSSTRPPPCLPATTTRSAFDSNQCAVDERPTSSSSSATTTSKEHHRQSNKRVRRRKKRKGEFADMPRLFPAFRKTVDSSPRLHEEQMDEEESADVPVPVNVGDKLSQMEAKFEQVCSRLDSALEKRSTDICSPTVVSTDLCSPTATNTSPSTASGPPSTSISLDCEDPTALAERLLSLKPDLIEQVANIIQSKTKCKDEQISSVGASKISGKEKRSKLRRPSSPAQSQSPSTDTTSDEKKKLMLDRLRQYRQKARRIVDTRLLEHIIDLSSQLRTVHIGGDQSLSDKSPIKSNWFSVNLEKVAHRIARRKRPASTEIGLENEADSGDDAVLASSSSQLVVINEHPRRISLKIKRGALINAEDSPAVTPKKCQNPETHEEDAETRRTKKRRKKPINPWDRKPTKKRRDSPVADDEDGAKSDGSPSQAAGTSKDVTGSDAICKVVLRRLSDERKHNDSFCVVPSAEGHMDYYYSSPSRKTSLKSGQTWSPTDYESETCTLRFDSDALQKCCQSFGRDFRLPYDIWAERRALVSPVVRKSSTDYRKIRSNIYIDQPPRDEDKQQACSCPPGAICGEDCLNRMMFVECSPGWCPCDETCTNRRFQRHQFCPFAQKFETTDGRGCGVRASSRITAGTFIFEYVGEVVTTDRFAGRMSTWYTDDRHHYGLDLCAGFVIDSYRSGNIARFVNHSCEPNCQMQKWNINGQYRVGLFALRDLEPGEELTYDYKFAAFEDDQVCTCGSAKCRGTISAARSKSSTESSPKGWSPRPLSHRERSYVAKHSIFLLRIFDRNYKKRFGATAVNSSQQTPMKKRPDMGKMIRTHLKALDTSSRTVQTRRLSVALEDECFLTLARLAQVLNQIYSAVLNAKDEYGHPIVHNGKKAKFPEFAAIKELILTGQFETPEKFDAAMKTALEKVQKSLADSKKSQSIMVAYGNAKRDCAEQLRDVLGFDLSASFLEQTPPTTPKRQKKETARAGDLIPTQTDLSYMDGGCVVGSYDPDDATDVWAPTANEGPSPEVDNVRCICGMFEEDGVMVQCDRCLYWLHLDCVHPPDGDDDYVCEFCTSKQVKAPAVDILLRPQPEVKLAACIYYRTLVNNNGLQIRLNETVYVKRLIDDHHKAILKKLHQQCVQKSEPLEEPDDDDGPPVLTRISEQQPKTSENAARERPSLFVQYQRKDLRAFRVERLFKGPNGQRFVFGCYYARPHETFCEPTRMFCRNELFWTPLFDTLPLDAVVGRCLVLEPSVWCKGRPRLPKYREDDIFVCEYRVDKSQRFFEKIAQKNRYYINTERYIFDSFEERLRIKRNFTPFIMPGGASEHPVKIVAESDDEDLVPLGVIRLNLQKRKRAQMTQRLERIVQSIAEQNM